MTSEKAYDIVLEILDDLEKQCDEPNAKVDISVGTSAAKEPRLPRHSKLALMVAQCRSIWSLDRESGMHHEVISLNLEKLVFFAELSVREVTRHWSESATLMERSLN